MKERAERIEYIRGAHESAQKDQTNNRIYPIKHWRGDTLYRKIISLDVDYLMFRLENSRTEVQQLAFIHKYKLPDNYFHDPESTKAQEAQEKVLFEMIKSKKETGTDFIENLKLVGQDEPAIITFDGFLVNGNRRTAVLKSLKERYIQCVVLPEDANPKDIYILEQQLQISQDFREDYLWLNELRNIRHGLEDKRLKFSQKELAENLRLDIKELNEKMFMLELVDAFLLWKNIPGQYDYPPLNDTSQIFIELEKARRNKNFKNDANKYGDLKNAIFTLIESRPKGRSLYYFVSNLIKEFDKVRSRVASPKSSGSTKVSELGDETLDELIEVGNEELSVPVFTSSTDAGDNSKKLSEAVADVKAENKEREDLEFAYESVSAALRHLTGLIIDGDSAKIDSVSSKLKEIISVSNELLKAAESISKDKS